MGQEQIPIETFHALLRDLLIWDLVIPGDSETGEADAWRLVAPAQQQLTELATRRGPWPAEQTVYVNRRCSDCGLRQLTRLRDGAYVCSRCWQSRSARGQEDSANVGSAPVRRPWWVPHRRQRIA